MAAICLENWSALRLVLITCNWMKTDTATMIATQATPKMMARLTGSLRRNSSAAWASASRLMRMGMVLQGSHGCADGDSELRGDGIQFRGLLRGKCRLDGGR